MPVFGLFKTLRRAIRRYQRPLQGRLRRREFGDHIIGVLMRSATGIYAIDIEDDAVRRTRRGYKAHGEDEIRRVSQFIDDRANVLVVGAHIGMIAIPVSRMCRTLWAIEANPKTFEQLQVNIAVNGAANVHALNIAANDREEEIDFVLNRTNSGGSKRMPKIKSAIYFYDKPVIEKVAARPLDDALCGTEFALVFMDCEGSEYFALKGMQTILGKASTLFVEFLPHHLRSVSGVSPEEFVDQISPHFSNLFIPSKNLKIARAEFKKALRDMYDHDEGDAGLVFTR